MSAPQMNDTTMNHTFPQRIPNLSKSIYNNVKMALAEDIGTGDITAQLISSSQNVLDLIHFI